MNKTQLARQYNCCWETIDRRLNPEKYKKEKKERIYSSMLSYGQFFKMSKVLTLTFS